ncbi:MAG: dephospho-CoA kinase [Alistipes sp.]|nr:dephospho-CoA kinase [Alistipes sp.]
MYKVGITGGIGSGKSTVCAILAEFGVAVYDSDSRAKRLMNESDSLRERLIERFGNEVYSAEGLNRAYLAERVFGNPEELKALNAIVHPAVMDDFDRWASEQEGSYVVLESAILFEASLDKRVDVSVAVMAPKELRIERAMQRDGAQREQIIARMNNQISDEERVERAKYTIVNIDIDNLKSDVEQLHRRLNYVAQAQRN